MVKTRLSSKFNRCVKSVKKTVRARKGSTKESAAIAICTKSVLQKRGRTMKRYSRKRLITQKKFRGGLNIPGVISGKTMPLSKLQQFQKGVQDIQAAQMERVRAAEEELKNSDGSIDDILHKNVEKAKKQAGLYGSEMKLARLEGR